MDKLPSVVRKNFILILFFMVGFGSCILIQNNTDQEKTEELYYLVAPKKKVDMTVAIQENLEKYGICKLGPGNFFVSGIDIPNYGMLCGAGDSTKLVLQSDIKEGYAVRLTNYGCIKDLRISGSDSKYSAKSEVGLRHGILFEGTADSSKSPTTYYRSSIDNCTVHDFSGGGSHV